MKTNSFLFAAGAALAMALTFSCSDDGEENGSIAHKEQFIDERDGKKYASVAIGSQTWMAENLNYEAEGSKCYGDSLGTDSLGTCAIYGRLYSWENASEACPQGWHLPSREEWDILMSYVQTDNGFSYYPLENTLSVAYMAGKYLKAKGTWESNSSVSEGEDKYGFAALPGGCYERILLKYDDISKVGYWWSSTEREETGWKTAAYCQEMRNNLNQVNLLDNCRKRIMYSVRCVQD
jgi:uncharacterized protein (TIGR02145 family)